MVKRCSWGTCNTDSRYPSRLEGGISFRAFPKPKTNLSRCLLWIKRCGRPHRQLNIDILRDYGRAKHLYVCTKHFREGEMDPLPAVPYERHTPARLPPKRRLPLTPIQNEDNEQQSTVFRVSVEDEYLPVPVEEKENVKKRDTGFQTDREIQTDSLIDPVDGAKNLEMLAVAAENRRLQQAYAKLVLDMENQERSRQETQATCSEKKLPVLSVDTLRAEDFQYYTGFSFQRFSDLFKFLIPNSTPFQYSKNMTCLNSISMQDQLLFVLMKLRQDFDFKHLAHLFNISQQDCSVLFNDWINYMFFRLGSLSIWPHRNVIIENMPAEYKKDFPNSMVIIDGTELKIQRPSALKSQSQCYSDYKSCTTLKALVGVDPRGSIIFTSMLFSGSISDKDITLKGGFYDVVKSLLKSDKLRTGDSVMADKGFTIEKELDELGIGLNIPPFAPSAGQMTAGDVTRTIKIAKHRVHVERAIARIKQFKLLSNKISLALFKSVNQIWLVCCLLTNFMPHLISRDT